MHEAGDVITYTITVTNISHFAIDMEVYDPLLDNLTLQEVIIGPYL